MMCTNNWVHYGLEVIFVYLQITVSHYHNYVDLSESVKYIKRLLRYIVLGVFKIKFLLLTVFRAIFGLWVLSLHISLSMTVRIFILHLNIFIESEIWLVNDILGLGHERMACPVCL